MKNIFFLATLSFLFFSCKKSDLQRFESKDALNFTSKTNTYSFLGNTTGEYIQQIPIKLMGNLSASDRTFSLDIIADSTTAPANLYEIIETKLPANSTDGILKIKVKNSTILDEESVKLRVRINGGAAFVPGNEEYAEYTLEWTNQVIAPASWTYFGAIFSAKKSVNVYKLIVEVTGMSVFTAAEYRALTVAGAEAIGYKFGNYVKQWNLDHPDDPKLHNDDTPIDPVYYNKAKYD